VSLLQPTISSEIPNRAIDPPPPIELDNSDEWEVHWVLDSRTDRHHKGSGLLYLVEWKGFDNTPMPQVGNCLNISLMHLTLSRHSIMPIQTSWLPESMRRGPVLYLFLYFRPLNHPFQICFQSHYFFILYFTVFNPRYTSQTLLHLPTLTSPSSCPPLPTPTPIPPSWHPAARASLLP